MRPVNKGNINTEYQANVLDNNTDDVDEIKNDLPGLIEDILEYVAFNNLIKVEWSIAKKRSPKNSKTRKKSKEAAGIISKPFIKTVHDLLWTDDKTSELAKALKNRSFEIKKYVYRSIKGAFKKRIKKLTKKRKLLITSISNIYPLSRGYLIKTIGPYCSYCGMFVRASLAVEHMLPKSEFPGKSVDWDNFLLACTNCNSLKGSKPPKSDGPTPQAVYDLYAWPDRDNTDYGHNLRNVSNLTFTKEKLTTVDEETGEKITVDTKTKNISNAPDASDINPDWIYRMFNDQKFAMVVHSGEVYVYLEGNSSSINKIALQINDSPMPTAPKFGKTLKLGKLNKFVSEVDVTDRRVPCRTMVFFRTCSAMNDLNTLSNAPTQANEMMSLLMEQIKNTMLVTGYWNVWGWTLNTYFGSFNKTPDLIAFLRDPNFFSGTR
jgi:hypothetical protein